MTRDPARKFFHKSLSDSERAAFEAGIALATVLHQFQGMPLPPSRRGIKRVEQAIEEAISAQPFRRRVYVKLRGIRRRRGVYGYPYLRPENLQASVEVSYGSSTVVASLRWIRSLNYPLMSIERMKKR